MKETLIAAVSEKAILTGLPGQSASGESSLVLKLLGIAS
jgi:hypothetical protein